MIQILKEYLHNYLEYREESRRINKEIDEDGIYKYIEKHYGFGPMPKSNLKQTHG